MENHLEQADTNVDNNATMKWYAMRDLKRPNAIDPAYKMLAKKGFEVFTPLVEKVIKRLSLKFVEEVPMIQDLLFVRSAKDVLDPIVDATNTLQYRFVKGGKYREATVVRDEDMNRFIHAVKSTPSPKYYLIGDITPDMIGRTVRIHGGPLDGYEVPLRKMRGSKKKRVFVELPNFLTAEVELTAFDFLEEVR